MSFPTTPPPARRPGAERGAAGSGTGQNGQPYLEGAYSPGSYRRAAAREPGGGRPAPPAHLAASGSGPAPGPAPRPGPPAGGGGGGGGGAGRGGDGGAGRGGATATSAPTRPGKRKRRLLLGLVGVVLVAGIGGAAWWFLWRDEAPADELAGLLLGSVETAGHEASAGAEVVVSTAGADGRELARTTTDEIGLFEVDLGGHEGPVVVRASDGAQHAATVVAVSPDGLTTGVRLVVGEPGTGLVEGQVTGSDGAALQEPATVEARFVETGRTDVVAVGPDARFRFDALPLDGDLILVATTARGTHQGLTATVVAESLSSNTADISLRSPADPAAANEIGDPEIVTEDLDGWVLDGPVTVVPADGG